MPILCRLMRIYLLTLLSIVCLFSSCSEQVNQNQTFSAIDLKNSIRICFKDKTFSELVRHEKLKSFRIITNYKLTDTVQVDSATFYVNPVNKADSSLYKFTAIITYPIKNEALVVFENQHEQNSFLIRLQNTLNFSFKSNAWVLTGKRSLIID